MTWRKPPPEPRPADAKTITEVITAMRAIAAEDYMSGCDCRWLMGQYADVIEKEMLDSYAENRDLRARVREHGP